LLPEAAPYHRLSLIARACAVSMAIAVGPKLQISGDTYETFQRHYTLVFEHVRSLHEVLIGLAQSHEQIFVQSQDSTTLESQAEPELPLNAGSFPSNPELLRSTSGTATQPIGPTTLPFGVRGIVDLDAKLKLPCFSSQMEQARDRFASSPTNAGQAQTSSPTSMGQVQQARGTLIDLDGAGDPTPKQSMSRKSLGFTTTGSEPAQERALSAASSPKRMISRRSSNGGGLLNGNPWDEGNGRNSFFERSGSVIQRTASWCKEECRAHSVYDSLLDAWDEAPSPTARNLHISERMLGHRGPGSSRWDRALHPHSYLMNVWESIGMLTLLVDCFGVPWYLSFYTGEYFSDRMIHACTFCPRVYWTCDMFVTAMKGYWRSDTEIERSLAKTAARYLRSWFACDLILVLCGWFFLFVSEPTVAAREHRRHATDDFAGSHAHWDPDLFSNPHGSWLVLLAVMCCGVVRHARILVRVYENLKMYMLMHKGQRKGALGVDIAVLVIAMVFINHVVSCVWYTIGVTEGADTGQTWLNEGLREGWPRQYFYFTALHWACTQMSPGSMEVVPHSSSERAYNIVVLIFGWVVATTITALLTSVLTGERLRFEERSRRFLHLQRYLLQEGVEHSLAMTVNFEVKAKRSQQRLIRWNDVEDLSFVCQRTRQELCLFIYGQRLRPNHFMRLLETCSQDAFALVCAESISRDSFAIGQHIFEEGTPGCAIMFLHHGVMQYIPGASATLELDEPHGDLRFNDGSWCCEAAFWCEWFHLGSMQAVENAEMLFITATAFCKSARRFPEAAFIGSEFSQAFIRTYTQIDARLSDLIITVDHADIIANTSRDFRRMLADVLLDPSRWSQHHFGGWLFQSWDAKQFEKLHKEIDKGESFVCLHGEEVVRTVFLVTLLIRRASDGFQLVKIGELGEDGCTKVGCVLPGTKQSEEECATAAITRLLKTELLSIADVLEVDMNQAEAVENMKASGTFGIRSRYMKTKFNAWVKDQAPNALPMWRFREANGHNPRAHTRSQNGHSRLLGGPLPASRRSPAEDATASRPALNAAQSLGVNTRMVAESIAGIKEVLVLPNRHSRDDIFIWLSETDFDALSSEAANEHLQAFMKSLHRARIEQRTANSEMSRITSLSEAADADSWDEAC